MNRCKLLQKIALCVMFFLSFNPVFADEKGLITCPSVDELKAFEFDFAIPYQFDNSTKSMKFTTFSDKSLDDDVSLILALYPVMVGTGEQPEKNMRDLIEKLQLESVTPLTYHMMGDKTQMGNMILPMCVYTLPGDNNVSALLVIVDNSNLLYQDFAAGLEPKNNNHQRAIKMIKRFMVH